MRIAGYLSNTTHDSLEQGLLKGSKETMSFLQLETNEMFIWVAHSKATSGMSLVYSSSDEMVLIDGPPVVKKEDFEIITAENIGEISTIISRIESNSPILTAEKTEGHIQLDLTSSRAGPGKMWYAFEKDALVFSNDIRILIHALGYQPDLISLYSIFRLGRILEPRSISTNIHCVSPGITLSATGMPLKLDKKREFRYSFIPTKRTISDFRNLLEKTTDVLSVLDVDLLMSGGVDSTLLAFMMDVSAKRGFYLMFDESDPELPNAEEAASKTGIPLKTFKMTTEDALDAIFECPKAHIQPTVDFSAINTFYLMNQIKKTSQQTIAVLDGNGTEFILGPMIKPKLRGWQLIRYVPCPIRKMIRRIYSNPDVFTFNLRVIRSLIPVARAAGCRVDVAPNLVYPMDGFLTTGLDKLDALYAKQLSSFVSSISDAEDFRSFLTIASLYTNCYVMLAKTHEVGIDPIKSIYPFLWKSFLIEQGTMSWGTKARNSMFKYPLKKMLEEYMPMEFVHRQKSGFTPPMERWILNSQVNERVKQVLDSLSPITKRIVSQANLTKAFLKARNRRSYPPQFLTLLWATLFTELWLQENVYYRN
ncbi:MAG: asparagine synthase-related protein [Promethearchaeota archaeon]